MKKQWWQATWKWSKSDSVVVIALLVIAFIACGQAVLFHVWRWITGAPIIWKSAKAVDGFTSTEALRGATGTIDARLILRIEHPGIVQRLGALLPSLWLTLVLAVGAFFMWRLIRHLAQTATFDKAAVHDVRAMCLTAAFYAATGWATYAFAELMVAWPTFATDPNMVFEIRPEHVVLFTFSLCVLVFAEVAARAQKMSDELAEVI